MSADTRGKWPHASTPAGRRARLILRACCAAHPMTDGLITAFYPLLPLIAGDLLASAR